MRTDRLTVTEGSLLGGLAVACAYGLESLADVALTVKSAFGAHAPTLRFSDNAQSPASCWIFLEPSLTVVGFAGVSRTTLNSYVTGLSPEVGSDVGLGVNREMFRGLLRPDVQGAIGRLSRSRHQLLCGHSLGGVVCAALDQRMGPCPDSRKRAVITFGSPRPRFDSVFFAETGARVIEWVRPGDGIFCFPPRGAEDLSISLSVAGLNGQWPFDWYHAGSGRLFDGRGSWVPPRPSMQFRTSPSADFLAWLLAGMGPIAVAHSFPAYARELALLLEDGDILWDDEPPTILNFFDAPPKVTNALLAFRAQRGFPGKSITRC